MKFKKVILPDGTSKLELVPDSPEVIEEKRKIHEEQRKKENESSKISQKRRYHGKSC